MTGLNTLRGSLIDMSHKGKTEKLEKCHCFKYCKNAVYTGKCESCGKGKLNFKNKYETLKELLDVVIDDLLLQRILISSTGDELLKYLKNAYQKHHGVNLEGS